LPGTRRVSCEGACLTVPSPLVGEGQGEGWRRDPSVEGCLANTSEQRPLLDCRNKNEAAPLTPLSLSLPHKGGGNAVALFAPNRRQHSRTQLADVCMSNAFAGMTIVSRARSFLLLARPARLSPRSPASAHRVRRRARVHRSPRSSPRAARQPCRIRRRP
jgi:hypothetical protein